VCIGNEAAERGVFAHITDDDPDQLQSTLDIVLRRLAEYHNLEGAFARRAMIVHSHRLLAPRDERRRPRD
jgi:hypothetical protein